MSQINIHISWNISPDFSILTFIWLLRKQVLWGNGNSFNMTFSSNVSVYDLSSFAVNLNVSSLYNESMGELVESDWRWVLCLHKFFFAANQTIAVSYANESFSIPMNFSYHCNSVQMLNATNGELVISKVQFEAFKTDNKQSFSKTKVRT